MSSPNVLITGGAGYIGSHTAKALAKAGWCPVVLDNMTAGHRWAVQWGPLIEGDFADRALLRRIIADYKIQAVVHMAASTYVGESIHNPAKYFDNNVTKGLALLDTLVEAGVGRIVFSSSCAIYGIPQTDILEESHCALPINPYGETKLFFERACHWYEQVHQLRSVCLRYFNAAGADPDGTLGEMHVPETHLIPLAIDTALGIHPQLTVFGTDFPTLDGTAVRDYVHVCDIAEAHVAALRYLYDGGESIRLNLGTGKGNSVREVIRIVETVSGLHVRTTDGYRRPGDPAVLVACADRARAVLGWQPKFTDLQDMVSTAWKWHAEGARRRPLATAITA
jgi:UDP-arabinose 4-epimerase